MELEITRSIPSFCNYIRTVSLGKEVGEYILEMARHMKLSPEDLEALTEKLPSFSDAEWEEVAMTFDLNPSLVQYQLQSFSVPHAYLPPSFHKQVMKN